MLANLSGVESESTISKFRKRKRKFLCCVQLPYYLTGTREIGKFHVAIVQRRLRYVQKSVMHVQSCRFANVSLLLFCRSRCRLCCFISILLSSRNLNLGVSWCCGNYCLLAFVLWCGYCSVSFQSFVLRHWCPQHQETTRNFAIMVTDVTLFFPIDEQNKTGKRRPCWCTEKILSVVNPFLM